MSEQAQVQTEDQKRRSSQNRRCKCCARRREEVAAAMLQEDLQSAGNIAASVKYIDGVVEGDVEPYSVDGGHNRSDGSETIVDDASEEEYAEEGPTPFGMED